MCYFCRQLNPYNMLAVAKIGKLFATEGALTLALYDTFPEKFDTDTPLFVEIDGLQVPLYCASFERRGQAGAVVRFDDIDTERRASELLGRELFAEQSGGEHDDEFYMEDLIGFEADAGALHGTVADYYDSDANPLLGIDFGQGKVLIPAVEEFITHIDFEARRIRLSLPEGLTDL